MSDTLPLITVVAPVFNEQDVLPLFHTELTRVLNTLTGQFDYEIIYVDDGSRDATPDLLHLFAEKDSRVRFIRFSRNFGQQAAMTAGFENGRGDAIITMDSDLQHPPIMIPQMLEKWQKGADVVLGIRQESLSLGFFKRYSSFLFHKTMRWCSGMELRPTVSEYRLLSRKAVEALLNMPERLRYLRGMIHWLGFPPDEVSFDVPGRAAGSTKYSILRMVRLARDGLLSFSRVPLHAALLFSSALIAFSFLASLSAWFIWRPQSGGWLALTLIVGMHTAATGIWVSLMAFSEYLARIHEQILGRPIYVVRETSESSASTKEAATPIRKKERTAA
ncbi:glycosyltransferase family 2 protein [Telmatocola sphagniphila]|uniref:Glycosyltransferase family 2 protein n=1 Tax=Telmatocola sphagniphila TaxID=1123043 RepID=A0A8E6ETF0_9BACT|nr:glycosyltransferase family 2 protein [Telmatocola sphagniphila]QVL29842.1 glycosyltransferase family 2 protein [Telmatocola sphagniphila]